MSMQEVRPGKLVEKIQKISEELGVGKVVVTRIEDVLSLGDVFSIGALVEGYWSSVSIASVRYTSDFSKIIIEELLEHQIPKELKNLHPRDYINVLQKTYSPLIRSIAERLSEDSEIKQEIVYVSRYADMGKPD